MADKETFWIRLSDLIHYLFPDIYALGFWGFGVLGFRIGNWDWGLGLRVGIGIGIGNWGLGLGIGDWRLGSEIGIGDWEDD